MEATIERASKLSKKQAEQRNSPQFKRVVGVLSALGFLIAPDVKALPSTKVDVMDAIRLGKEIEPRILEVLPAAVLSFPRSFFHIEAAPESFHEVLLALKRGKKGPSFEGISFKKLYEAANRPVADKRRKVISKRKIPKTFRLSPDIISALETAAEKEGLSATSYIEKLIEEAVRRSSE